jgi:transcriptional regulator with XRE-family HTH domain
MDVRQILGERVRRRRMALGLNQTAFADTVGIPVPTLSSIEHGHQSIYVERAVHLAQALAVSTDYLLGLTDDPQPRPATAKAPKAVQEPTPPVKRPRTRKAAPVA